MTNSFHEKWSERVLTDIKARYFESSWSIHKKNSNRTFKLFELNLIKKVINHLGLKVSTILNQKETLVRRIILHKDGYSLV